MLQRPQRERDRLGAGRDADGEIAAAVGGELVLEGLQLGAEGERSGSRDAIDDLEQLFQQRGVGLVQAGNGDRTKIRAKRGHAATFIATVGRALHVAESGTQSAASAVVQPVNGRFGAAEAAGDLAGAEPDEVTEHDDLALLVGQRGERVAQYQRAVMGRLALVAHFGLTDVLARDRPALAHVVESDVARDAQDPRGEGHLPLLVLPDDRHELGEDVLRHVLGLVVVTDDAADVAVHVVGVAEVEEADRLAVTFLGTRHRPADDAVGDRAVIDRQLGAELAVAAGGIEPAGEGLKAIVHMRGTFRVHSRPKGERPRLDRLVSHKDNVAPSGPGAKGIFRDPERWIPHS